MYSACSLQHKCQEHWGWPFSWSRNRFFFLSFFILLHQLIVAHCVCNKWPFVSNTLSAERRIGRQSLFSTCSGYYFILIGRYCMRCSVSAEAAVSPQHWLVKLAFCTPSDLIFVVSSHPKSGRICWRNHAHIFRKRFGGCYHTGCTN